MKEGDSGPGCPSFCVYWFWLFFCLRSLRSSFTRTLQFFEELGEHVAALLFENPSGYFYLVIEGGVFQDVEDGSGTAGFWGSCSL